MNEIIEKIRSEFFEAIKNVKSAADLEPIRIKFLGRKGLVSTSFDRIAELPKEQRPLFGKALNELKKELEKAYQNLQADFKKQQAEQVELDLTLPGRKPFAGRKHPLLKVADEIKQIFVSLGFTIEDGPEVETDFYNFEALNIPKTHPARDMQDTLYITEDILLRTHTSPVQIRVMQRQKPPIQMIAPGRVYRRDTPDASHSPFFHQVEGLVVDKGITFADLKGVIQAFAHRMFGPDIKVRIKK